MRGSQDRGWIVSGQMQGLSICAGSRCSKRVVRGGSTDRLIQVKGSRYADRPGRGAGRLVGKLFATLLLLEVACCYIETGMREVGQTSPTERPRLKVVVHLGFVKHRVGFDDILATEKAVRMNFRAMIVRVSYSVKGGPRTRSGLGSPIHDRDTRARTTSSSPIHSVDAARKSRIGIWT